MVMWDALTMHVFSCCVDDIPQFSDISENVGRVVCIPTGHVGSIIVVHA